MSKTYSQEEIKAWLLKPGNNYCVMPYSHLAIEGNGDIRPCCIGDPIKKEDGSTVNITGHSINEVLWDKDRQAMIDAFDRNEQYPNCNACWSRNDEFSPRVKFSSGRQAAHITSSAMDGNRDRNMSWLEIKPGNRCNLKCRICGLWNSSSWAMDQYNRHPIDVPYKDSYIKKYMDACNWIDEEKVWTEVDGLEHVDWIHIMGGEPFMIPEHVEFLKRFEERYGVSNLNLWYNTNGTIPFTDDYIQLFSRMKHVLLSVSIDDIGKRFEYQRKNAIWRDTTPVLDQLFALDREYHHICTTLDPTVSIYNIYYLNEFIEECYERGYQFSDDPRHFDDSDVSTSTVLALKIEQKEKIRDHLLQGKYATHPLIVNAINFMFSKHTHTDEREETRIFDIKNVDRLRNERFDEIFPEMNEILGIYE